MERYIDMEVRYFCPAARLFMAVIPPHFAYESDLMCILAPSLDTPVRFTRAPTSGAVPACRTSIPMMICLASTTGRSIIPASGVRRAPTNKHGILPSLVEHSIAIAGFSGIAVAVEDRAERSAQSRIYLTSLLWSTFNAAALSVLAIVLCARELNCLALD